MSKSPNTQKYIPLLYRVLPPSILSLITILTYYPSLNYNFQFDDIANIQKHFYIRHHQFKNLFLSGSRWISYWLNSLYYSIGKFDPFVFRLGNLIIHTTNGLLLFFLILYALLHSQGQHFFKRNALSIAIITSMLFLLHPVQTQTVSYVIQGQLEGLACMFILAMGLTFLHFCYTQSFTKKIALATLLFCLAFISCGTKEIAILSPFLMILLDWFFVAHGSWSSLKQRWWVHGILLCIVTFMYIFFLKLSFFTNILSLNMQVNNNIGNIITAAPKDTIGPWQFFISQFKVILHYIWMFIWPFNISVEYDWVLVRHFFAWDCIIPFFMLLSIGLVIFRVLLTKPTHVLCFGALWFFICIAPRSSIIPSPELLVDYKTYTASIGWLFIIACAIVIGIEFLVNKIIHYKPLIIKRQTSLLLTAILALPLSFMTWQRNQVWSSGTEFWMNVIKNAPGKARAYNNYGVELSQTFKKYEEAIPYFKKATQMDPHYPDPLNNLALCYSQIDQVDNAIEVLKQGLKINPYYPEGYNNLASFYLRNKDYTQAQKCLNTALQLRPHYGKAYFNLGRLYAEQGDNKMALECFKKACTIADLDNEFGYKIYAQAALNQKEYADAIWAYSKAHECNPADTETLFTLANCYYLSQQYGQSIKIYKHLLSCKPDDIRTWYNLGESYFMQENIADAMQCFKQIESQWTQLPQLRIRLANCYEKMNQHDRAQQELHMILKTAQIPAQIKIKAKEMLAHLQQHAYMQQKEVLA